MNTGRYQAIFDSEEQNWWYRGRRFLITFLIHEYSKGNRTHILDIGCGTGKNIQMLSAFGKTYGVDIAEESIELCRKRSIENVYRIKNNTYPFRANTFTLATCLDVLEHEKNEIKLLREAYRVLKPGGIFLLTVPADPKLWSRLDTDSHHIRRYTKNTFTRVLKQSKFTLLRVSYVNFVLYLPILFIRLFQRTGLGKQTSWGIRPDFEPPIMNKLLEPIFKLDIRLLRYFSPPFGVSLFAVVQKPLTMRTNARTTSET